MPGLTLPAYLITPVQRIPRYILLLKVWQNVVFEPHHINCTFLSKLGYHQTHTRRPSRQKELAEGQGNYGKDYISNSV